MTVGVVAGSLFGVLGNFASRRQPGRDSVLLIGYVAHMVAFYLIFVTFPADSPLQESEMKPYFTPRLSSQCMAFIALRLFIRLIFVFLEHCALCCLY